MPEEELNARIKQMLVSSLMLNVSAPDAGPDRRAHAGGDTVAWLIKTNKRSA